MQPFLNAYPLPNGSDNAATGVARFNASFSSRATLDASSLRIDHRVSDKINLFARYNYSPSEIIQRGGGSLAASVVTPIQITTQTGTVGARLFIAPMMLNDVRFNYRRANSKSHSFLDDFGGAVPLAALPFPSSFTDQSGQLNLTIFALNPTPKLAAGLAARNVQRQFNFVDSFSLQKSSHSLKFGADFRRLSPTAAPEDYLQSIIFGTIAAAKAGSDSSTVLIASSPATLLFRNLGLFAQDTWHVAPRLTLTYGLRWDVDFAPSTLSGPGLPAVTGFDINDLSQLAIAPPGAPSYRTPYG